MDEYSIKDVFPAIGGAIILFLISFLIVKTSTNDAHTQEENEVRQLHEKIRLLERENLILFRENRHLSRNLENCLNQL